MTVDNNTKSMIKAQWVILKDESAKIEDKVDAYQMLQMLNKKCAEEPDFTVIDPANTRYKIYANLELAKSSPKPIPPSTEAKPTTSSSTASASPQSAFVPIAKFEHLTEEEVKMYTKKIHTIFEIKNLVERIASESYKNYNNGASVGQVLGILLEK